MDVSCCEMRWDGDEDEDGDEDGDGDGDGMGWEGTEGAVRWWWMCGDA